MVAIPLGAFYINRASGSSFSFFFFFLSPPTTAIVYADANGSNKNGGRLTRLVSGGSCVCVFFFSPRRRSALSIFDLFCTDPVLWCAQREKKKKKKKKKKKRRLGALHITRFAAREPAIIFGLASALWVGSCYPFCLFCPYFSLMRVLSMTNECAARCARRMRPLIENRSLLVQA